MRRSWPALAMLAGCYDLSIAVVMPPPILDPGVSTIVLAIEAGLTFELHALPVTDGAIDPARLPIKLDRVVDPEQPVVLEALLYRVPLEDLGLTAGLNESSTSEGAVPLPTATRVLRLDPIPGASTDAWSEAPSPSARLRAFRVSLATDCARFDGHTVTLTEAGLTQAVFAAEVEPGVVWLGLAGDEPDAAFRITASSLDRLNLAAGHRSLFVPAPGHLWMGRDDSTLIRARLRGELRVEETLEMPGSGAPHWLSGPSSTASVDLFGLTVDGVVEHYDGAYVEHVHTFAEQRSSRSTGGIAWVGPQEAIVAWHGELGVTRVKRRAGRWSVTVEPTPGSTQSLTAAAYSPSFGPIVANGDGRFFTMTEGSWAEIPGSPTSVLVFVVAPYRDGFVFGTPFGTFAQYTPSSGFCPPIELALGAVDIKRVAVLASGAIVAASGPQRDIAGFTWLEPR